MTPRVSVSFAWYDLWIGAFWDRKRYVLYVCPLPCLLITVAFVHPALQTPDIKAAHLAAAAEMKQRGASSVAPALEGSSTSETGVSGRATAGNAGYRKGGGGHDG